LIFTGYRLLRHRNDEGEEGTTVGLGVLGRILPVSEVLDGQRFFTRLNGRRAATPLLAALVVVEVTDVIFAVDSVPAILALSHEQFLIFSSNAFAILGLRAMYFVLADARARFHYLNHALGTILVFVGAKMIVAFLGWHLSTWISLGVILGLLMAAIGLSRVKDRRLANDAHRPARGGQPHPPVPDRHETGLFDPPSGGAESAPGLFDPPSGGAESAPGLELNQSANSGPIEAD
jgi:tellurite resistance protein TerC